MAKAKRKDRIVWLSRGWQDIYIGFCPSKEAWDHFVKKTGYDDLGDYPPSRGNAGCVDFLRDPKARKRLAIVTISEELTTGKSSPVEMLGVVVHEVKHVMQSVIREMGATKDGIAYEWEAYGMQAIFQEVLRALLETRDLKLTVRRQKKAPPAG